MNDPWGILWAGLASGAFGVLFNVRFRDIPAVIFSGSLGWALYLGTLALNPHGPAFFFASMGIALYGEIAGHFLHRPATTFLVCALIPLVPGGGMYFMMYRSLSGDLMGSLDVAFQTLSTALAIAAGVAVGSAFARLSRRL